MKTYCIYQKGKRIAVFSSLKNAIYFWKGVTKPLKLTGKIWENGKVIGYFNRDSYVIQLNLFEKEVFMG